MKVKFNHPADVNVDEVYSLARSDIPILTSPHVGNLDQFTNPYYLSLSALGVSLMFVDTISAHDRHGRPQLMVEGGEQRQLTKVGVNRRKKLLPAAVLSGVEDKSLQSVHLDPVAASSIEFLTTSSYEDIVHPDLAEVLLQALSATLPDRLIRVSREGRVSSSMESGIKAAGIILSEEYKRFGIFNPKASDGDLSGCIIPSEAGIAADIVAAVLSGTGRVVHIGGSDMSRYLEDLGYQTTVRRLAEYTLASLGLHPKGTVTYTILDKNKDITGLAELSFQIATRLGVDNFSQHDLDGVHPSKFV